MPDFSIKIVPVSQWRSGVSARPSRSTNRAIH